IGSRTAPRGDAAASASGAGPSATGGISLRESGRPLTDRESLDVESTRTPVVVKSDSIASLSAGRATENASVGHLVVRAVDAATNEPLLSFGVRCVSAARLADELSQDPG